MQNTKDSFYITLRDRLAALDPTRTVTVLGNTRPGILVVENEVADAAPLLPDAFYLRFGAVVPAAGTERLELPLLKLACEVSYWTQGTDDLSSQDRGRSLAKLDEQLLAIALPPRAALFDHSQTPAVALGTNLFWTRPEFAAPRELGRTLTRTVSIEIFVHAEAA